MGNQALIFVSANKVNTDEKVKRNSNHNLLKYFPKAAIWKVE